MFFSITSKNSNWEILTKNLVLKDKMGLTVKNFNIFEVHWKIQFLGGGGLTKNQYRGGIASGGMDSLQI